MRRVISLFRYFGFHLLLLVMAAVLFCWPFGRGSQALEAGAMFPYLLAVWGFFIVVLFVVSLDLGKPEPGPGSRPGETGRDV